MDDLKEKFSVDNINYNKQKIGLMYYDIYLNVIRKEMDKYNDVFLKICKSAFDMKFSINEVIGENITSGDIDVLISGPKGKNKIFRNKFLECLKTENIVREILASGSKNLWVLIPDCKEYRHLDVIDTDIDHILCSVIFYRVRRI